MRRIRATGNRSTEWRLRAALIRKGFRGWTINVRQLPGRPDFVFKRTKLAIFVDGCFWHGCSDCKRPMPKTNASYWRAKISRNVKRASEVAAALSTLGYRWIRIWEHEIQTAEGLAAAVDKIMQLRRVEYASRFSVAIEPKAPRI